MCQTGKSFLIDAENFLGLDLSYRSLHRAILVGRDLSGSNFEKTDLRGALLSNCHLVDCKFDNANLINADLDSSISIKATFRGAHLIGASFENANLKGCDFSDADVEFCRFLSADLRGAILNCKNIEQAIFSGCTWDLSTIFPRGFMPPP
jgi:uncharacterized protein YjbI with pentapeptide repeats